MSRPALALLVAAVASSAGCLAALGLGSDDGAGAPLEFALTTTDGSNVTHEDYRGRVLVLDLMATWCAPCKAGMPHLREFHAAHPEVALLSVDVDPTERDGGADPLPEFRDRYNATWEFAYDTDDVFRRSGARLLPTIVIVDADGRVRERVTEYPLTAEELAARVAPLVVEAEAGGR